MQRLVTLALAMTALCCASGNGQEAPPRADAASLMEGLSDAGSEDAGVGEDGGVLEVDGGVSDAGTAIQVLNGIDVLLSSPAQIAALGNLRLGLITNQTGITLDGGSSIDALHNHPTLNLVALFSPEHGIRGTAKPGESVSDSVDVKTGLPIRSLYGTTRKPTPAMLADLDVLLFDIQDIGARYYTYVWTMALAMETAAENNKKFVVLDRPNPIDGEHVEGNVLNPAFKSFVGLYPVPMRHGFTAGELAQWISGEYPVKPNLTVVQLSGWQRSMTFEETGLAWVAPSPAIPTVESAAHYPGSCLFEGTNLSMGRGTSHPFQQFGAPWLSSQVIADRLNAAMHPGVRFDVVTFTPQMPSDGKFPGQLVKGVRFVITDRAAYRPVETVLAFLVEARKLHGAQLAVTPFLDTLAGTDKLRLDFLAGKDVTGMTAGWSAQVAAFKQQRAQYLIYP